MASKFYSSVAKGLKRKLKFLRINLTFQEYKLENLVGGVFYHPYFLPSALLSWAGLKFLFWTCSKHLDGGYSSLHCPQNILSSSNATELKIEAVIVLFSRDYCLVYRLVFGHVAIM